MHVQSRLLSVAIVTALAAAPVAAHAFNGSVAQRAQGLLDGPAARGAHRADADRFVARDVIVDADGTEHVRFDRSYRGLPVLGGDLVVHSRNGQVRGISQSLGTTRRPDLAVQVGAERAIVEAGTRFGTGFAGMPT